MNDFIEQRRIAVADLHEEWRSLRDGNTKEAKSYVLGMVRAFCVLKLLDADDCELWKYRIGECPGHDDEGGRDWCAYCGKLSRAASDLS